MSERAYRMAWALIVASLVGTAARVADAAPTSWINGSDWLMLALDALVVTGFFIVLVLSARLVLTGADR